MLAHEHSPQPRWRPAPVVALSTSSNVVTTEQMRLRVEAEAKRHARYLQGYGLIRLLSFGGAGREALEESLATETRSTDAVCLAGDGSFAVLVVNADLRTLEIVAERLLAVAGELAEAEGESKPGFVAGCAAAGQRRLTADEVWGHSTEALRIARNAGGGIYLHEGH